MTFEDIDDLIEKYKARPGLKGKIIANCIYCSVGPGNGGTWRQQVENCGCMECPLYSVRPVSEPRKK